MFKKTITITCFGQIHDKLKEIEREVNDAEITQFSKELAIEQVKLTLTQFEEQMSRRKTARFVADRLFESDEYKIVIKARKGINSSLIDKVKTFFGVE